MAGLTPLPPHILHNSTRLTHAQAHSHLSKFLSTAENDAAYRPDSTLTERGPQSASTGTNPNLTLHHLQRILQGIEGKRIGGEDVGRFFGEGARIAGPPRKRKFEEQREKREQMDDGNQDQVGTGVAVHGEEDGWQDKEDYDLAQQDDEVDMNAEERHPGGLPEPGNAEEAEEMAQIRISGTSEKVGLSAQHATASTADKKARKEAKKMRLKEQKRQREDAKTGK